MPGGNDSLPEHDAPVRVADRETFAALFRRFYTPLARYARRLTGNDAMAEDVLQDVFAKLWEDRERITVEVSFKALLYTMVRNRALNMNRRSRRIATDVVVEDLHDWQDAAPAPTEVLAAADLRGHLYQWIDELAPRRAEAFTLSRYQGLSHREIAAVMGVSERTVDTHILLALRELRRRLDELQQEDPSP